MHKTVLRTMLTQNQIDGVIAFHGHHCPGLTFGMKVGDWVLNEFGHAPDEEIVAVVETDMCAVDAIQYLVGCTFGKGNLVFLDYGKNAYSFFRRSDGKSCRLVTRGGLLSDLREQQEKLDANDIAGREQIRQQMIDRIFQADFGEIFSICSVRVSVPETARIHASKRCDSCGELVMATRLLNDPVLTGGKNLCIPCRTVYRE
ncbi:MAG: FmdE family protein [Planctomycetaceae bacterium]|nr:FmdE family protein [Planctomycetaceae bacterium]